MSYLCIKKQEPTAGAKGIMCGGVFLPVENYEAGAPTPAEQIPSDGLALYVPLSEAPSVVDGWIAGGTITYKTVDGVPCANFNGSNSNVLQSSFQFEATEFTVSIVFNARSFTPESGNIPYLFNFGMSNSDNSRLALRLDNYWNKNGLAMVYNGAYLVAQNLSVNKWYFAQIKFDGAEMSLYLDGELQLKQSVSAMTIDDGLFVGRSPNGDNAFNGYLSSLRAYNRALSDAEIKLLAREFVFNSAPVEGKKGLLIPVGESVAAPPANGLVFSASYAEDMTDADGESPTEGTGYTIVEDAAGFKCLDVEKSNMQNSISYAETQEKMQFGTGNFAVGFYLKSMKPWANYNGIILTNVLADSGFTGFVFYKNRDSGKKSMVVRFGTGTDIYSESDVDTNWHHWLFMRDGDTVKLYKDGKVDATKAYSGTVNAHEDLYIGGYYSNWSSFTSAYFRLSNVRIYNRALTEAEIQSVALEHNPAKSLFIPLQTAYGTPKVGQKGIIVRSSQTVGYANYSKSAETMPTDGLTLYAPLAEASETAETGQALTVNNSGITYQTLDGIPCMTKGGTSAYLSVPISFTGSFTLSFWIRTTYTGNYVGMAYVGGLSIFDSVDSSKNFQLSAKKSSSERADFSGILKPLKWRDGAWHHIALSITSEESRLYCDGTLVSTASGVTPSISATMAYIGYDNDGDYALASYAMWRAYKRALSDAEIKTLAGEYKQEEVKNIFIAVKGTEIADIPQDGLIFHAPFNGNTTPNVGAMVLVGNEGEIAYNTQDGITYAVLPGTFGWRIYAQGTTDLTVGNEYSYICYYRDNSDHSKSRRFLMNMNLGPRYQNTYVPNSVNKLNVCDRTIDSSSGKWHFICIRSNGSVASIKGFLDTSTWTSGAPGNSPSRTDSFLAATSDWATSSQGQFWHGGIFDFAVYNRILTDAEVESLYQRIFWLQA